jgi:hypothetical protein
MMLALQFPPLLSLHTNMSNRHEKRGTLASAVMSKVQGLGAKAGLNSYAQTSGAWIGNNGPYTNTFTNTAADDLVLFCWGPAGSWVNAIAPLISVPIPSGQNVTISYAEGASGACAPVFGDTSMVNGQLHQTWLEYTFAGIYSTYDVSREVNMGGRSISTTHYKADGSKGCTTDMNTCVFMCTDRSAASCWFGYELVNCGASNGGGSGYDPKTGGASGGCNGLTAGAGNLQTYLS